MLEDRNHLRGAAAKPVCRQQASECHARVGAGTAEEVSFAVLAGLRLEQGRAGDLADMCGRRS
jgi:hypothetical protein